MEAELEDERKQKAIAVNARNKLQGDLSGMEQQVEMANKVKEDAVKQYKKLAAQIKDFHRELDEARVARDEIANQAKDNEKKVRVVWNNIESASSKTLRYDWNRNFCTINLQNFNVQGPISL